MKMPFASPFLLFDSEVSVRHLGKGCLQAASIAPFFYWVEALGDLASVVKGEVQGLLQCTHWAVPKPISVGLRVLFLG